MHRPIVQPAPVLIPGGMLAFLPIETRTATSATDGAGPDAPTLLEPEESALAFTLPESRRASFIAGRLALRAAVHAVRPDLSRVPLLRTIRGGPQLPVGLSGSVSHKRLRAVALAAAMLDSPDTHVGIDLEERPLLLSTADGEPDTRERLRADSPLQRSLATRILTARERDMMGTHLDPFAYREATLLRFAIKEAVYKAIDPFVARYVRFTEVELEMPAAAAEAGHAEVHLLLPERAAFSVRATWFMQEDWIIALAISQGR